MLIAVHTLALLTAPVLFLGALGLSRRLSSPDRLGIAALVLYGFAMVAVVSSAVTDGLVSPNLLRQIVSTSPPASDLWRALFRYNGYVDAAFAEVFIVASSLAVTLWSAAILRNRALARGLGIFGAVIGPAGGDCSFLRRAEICSPRFGPSGRRRSVLVHDFGCLVGARRPGVIFLRRASHSSRLDVALLTHHRQ